MAMACSNCPERRYSSARAAKAIDAGSIWTRRFNSSIRAVSDTIEEGYCTVTVLVTVPVLLVLSVTLSVTLKLAAALYACDGAASVLVEPSPKSHE